MPKDRKKSGNRVPVVELVTVYSAPDLVAELREANLAQLARIVGLTARIEYLKKLVAENKEKSALHSLLAEEFQRWS